MSYKNPAQQLAYQNEWMRRRRREWFDKNGPCAKCRSWNDLQIDHRDPATKINHRVWSWRQDRRDAELAKCQVLCATCHNEKTKAYFAILFSGDGSHFAKLTSSNVADIRARAAERESFAELGVEFGVATNTIRRIVSNKLWKQF